ncbi:MAG: phosphotransacetylase family protein [Chloroflexi bacterium]|nr:phosphotransacetylase family protein [Chloroflexota bacterium]
MPAVYITSPETAAGKTALCAGLGRKWQRDGKKVGYVKPHATGGPGDSDGVFMASVLGLEQAAAFPDPMPLATTSVAGAKIKGAPAGQRMKDAYDKLSQGRDVVLVEGPATRGTEDPLGRASGEMAETLGAKAILVARYRPGLNLGTITAAAAPYSSHLAGVIFNAVPPAQGERLARDLHAALQGAGIRPLGLIPEDRLLYSPSVGDLAHHLRGKILNSEEMAGELVENFLVGALSPDSGLPYFSHKGHKAVIARADRPDMHLAALETDTRCLILTGGGQPHPVVSYRAQELGIPIIKVEKDTRTVMEELERLSAGLRFRQEKKIERIEELLGQYLDWPALERALS